jgi:nucleotide-binding universal stress UspA family protein
VEKFFERILCPVDFDDNSIAALRYAADLAKANDATLYVLHVLRVPQADPGSRLEAYPPGSEEPSKLELRKIARRELEGKARYELSTRSGNPADVINHTADELGADLIVMSTHGRTGVTRFFLGSVAERVVRASNRPVLTVRPKNAGE